MIIIARDNFIKTFQEAKNLILEYQDLEAIPSRHALKA